MLKLFGFLTRRPDLTLRAFSEHWSGVHRELALRLVAPGIMRAYVQNHRQDVALEEAQAPCDGLPEVWLDDLAALTRLVTCPEYLEGAYRDEPNFKHGRDPTAIVRTVWSSTPRPAGGAKLMCFLPVAHDLAWDAAAPWWLPDARPDCLQRDRCLTSEELGGLRTAPWQAIESIWWPDLATALRAWAGRAPTGERRVALLVRELIVLRPPATAGG